MGEDRAAKGEVCSFAPCRLMLKSWAILNLDGLCLIVHLS